MFSNVISKNELRQAGKRALLVAALLLGLIVIGVIVSAVSAQRADKNFALAADFPRGALVYAQFKDLPGLLAQWNESQLKERYLNSVNFQQMQSRHLAMKLVARWEEFNAAAGFPLDLAAFGSVADNQAAIAVYDIGRLDLLLIAPMSQTTLDACVFVQGKDNFEYVELPDGTTYYLRDVEADRGRQKQHMAFASVKGRFVLATSESLLLRAVANINQEQGQGQGRGQAGKKDRLSDESDFQALAKTMAAARLVQPSAIEGPLFAEFARASVIALQNPASLDKASGSAAGQGLLAATLLRRKRSTVVGIFFRRIGGLVRCG